MPSGTPGTPAIPIGGDEMFLTQIEVRVRAVRLYGSWLEVAAFLDAGDVAAPTRAAARSHQPQRSCTSRSAAGCATRRSIGTIRADVGVRLNRLSDFEPDGRPNPDPHQPVAFHLSIGEPF